MVREAQTLPERQSARWASILRDRVISCCPTRETTSRPTKALTSTERVNEGNHTAEIQRQ